MYLVTTGLTEFWDTDQENLFLDSGCLDDYQHPDRDSFKCKVMTSPWEDRKRYYEAIQYVDNCYEETLARLASYLNEVHQVDYQQRYWRILVGPWLSQFLHAMYDRYVHLTEAFGKYPALQTCVLDSKSFRVPSDMAQFSAFRKDGVYNLQLVSQLLHGMEYSFPAKGLANGLPQTQQNGTARAWSPGSFAKDAVKWPLRFAESTAIRALSGRRQVGLCEMYMSRAQLWRLVLRSGLSAVPIQLRNRWSFPMPDAMFDDRRNGLDAIPATDEFQRILTSSLTHNFPALYLEGFQAAKAETLKKHTKMPEVLASLIGWYFSEPFKFLAAEASERGSRLMPVQHGGGYGFAQYFPWEEHESSLSDTYMVWGWADQRANGCQDLPCPKLAPLLKSQPWKPDSHQDAPVLLVAAAPRGYVHRFGTAPGGGHAEGIYDWQVRFMEAVSPELRSSILYRARPGEDGALVRGRISRSSPDIQWDHGMPFHKRLRRSRMAVVDHPTTTFLETLVANIPTVLFWDPQRWEFRPESQPHFDELKDMGILWDDPEGAASKVESVYQDPWQWWGGAELQAVRRSFVNRYALTSKDWARQWAKALKQEVAFQRKSNGSK